MVTTTGLFQELRLHMGCTAPWGRGCWGGRGEGHKVPSTCGGGDGRGRGTGSARASWTAGDSVSRRILAANHVRGLCRGCPGPDRPSHGSSAPHLASTSLLLLRAWLPGFTAPPQSNSPSILTLLHPNSPQPPNSPRPITSLLLSAFLSASGPILLVSTSPMPFYHLAIATPSPPPATKSPNIKWRQ